MGNISDVVTIYTLQVYMYMEGGVLKQPKNHYFILFTFSRRQDYQMKRWWLHLTWNRKKLHFRWIDNYWFKQITVNGWYFYALSRDMCVFIMITYKTIYQVIKVLGGGNVSSGSGYNTRFLKVFKFAYETPNWFQTAFINIRDYCSGERIYESSIWL